MRCPAYKSIREGAEGEGCTTRGMEVLRADRDIWRWPQLKRNREFLYGIISSWKRMGLQGVRGERKRNEARAKEEWDKKV